MYYYYYHTELIIRNKTENIIPGLFRSKHLCKKVRTSADFTEPMLQHHR